MPHKSKLAILLLILNGIFAPSGRLILSNPAESLRAYQRDAAMDIVRPLPSPKLASARVFRYAQGRLPNPIDYAGTPALAYGQLVPFMSWSLLAKHNQADVDAPLDGIALQVFLATGLLFCFLGLIFGLRWRAQQLAYLERIRTQEQQHSNLEQRFYALAKLANDAILICDEHGKILDANQRTLQMYGYTPDELIGAEAQRLGAEPIPREVFQPGQAAPPDQTTRIYETCHRHRDGHLFPVEIGLAAIQTDEGRRFQMIIRDISERTQLLHELQDSEQRFRAIFEQTSAGVAVIQPDGHLLQVNGRFCEILGYCEAELLQKKIQDITCPEDLEIDAALRGEILVGRIAHSTREKRYVCQDGHWVWINATSTLVRSTEMAPAYFVTVIEDISDRKAAEASVRALTEQLEERVRERTAKLETANHDLESFSYSISHDLRAPLRAIHGFAAILEEDYAPKLDREGLRLLKVVSDNAHRMGQLIDDILELSRAGRLHMHCTELNMNAMVDAVWTDLSSLPPIPAMDFHRDDLPAAWGDPIAIQQVWQNLLSNAIKFSRGSAPPKVWIRARQVEGALWYEVTDNGVGFNPDYAHKLFGLFQRLHGMEEFEGTGVGLAIVKRFVQKHGGQVAGDGRHGAGACFRFSLPAANTPSSDNGDFS